MSKKITELPSLTVVDDTVVVPIVDVSGSATSKQTTIGAFRDYILSVGLPYATDTSAGAIKVGTSLVIDGNGTLAVKIGDGIGTDGFGALTVPTKKFHGFSVDANSNLIYSTTTDSSVQLQNQYGADIYEDSEIGTNNYSYSMDAAGNLIVTFS